MMALDLFCGAGGMTDGMMAAGFDVLGVDVVRRPEYRGRLLLRDVAQLQAADLGNPVWLHASPPCQRFSLARAGRVLDPPTDSDLDPLRHALRLRDELRPRFWSAENVRGALPWFTPILGPPRLRHGPFYFWGNFPPFLTERTGLNKGIFSNKRRGLRDPWLRARLPIELTRPMAHAIRDAL